MACFAEHRHLDFFQRAQADRMIRMKVAALSLDPLSNLPLVLLTDAAGQVCIPIAIGVGEAAAIAAELDAIELERPMTHQLACALLAQTGAEVVRVELDQDLDGVVIARIVLRLACGDSTVAPARPSDALAFALRTGAVIDVGPAVLERAAEFEAGAEPALGPEDLPLLAGAADGAAELLAALDAGAFGKWKM